MKNDTRKIIASLFISLDGVVEAPSLPGGWAVPYIDDELNEQIDAKLPEMDAILLGPVTYKMFAEIWPKRDHKLAMADFLNNTSKFVATHNPEAIGDLSWLPVTIFQDELTTELIKLKKQPGKDILIPGSPRLVRSVLREGLLDELMFSVCPVVAGSGLRLFDEIDKQITLKLVDEVNRKSGMLSLTYHPENTHKL